MSSTTQTWPLASPYYAPEQNQALYNMEQPQAPLANGQMYTLNSQTGSVQQLYGQLQPPPPLQPQSSSSASSTLEKPIQDPSPSPRAGWPAYKWPVVQFINFINAMLLGYDVSNVANIQAPIVADFGRVELLTWVAIGYTAVNACVVPLCRRLYMFGDARWHFYVYAVIWMIGAAVAGAATSMDLVVLGRAIIGIGGAGLYQGIMFYNYTFSTPLEAPRGQALIGVGFALGLLLGPVIGGAFAENHSATWRWAMYINIPVLAALIAGWVVFLPSLHLAQTTGRPAPRLRDVDVLGWLLHSAFFLMLCSSLIFSGTRWAWSSASCITAWVMTGVLGVVYVTQQAFCIFTTPEDRIFPVRVFRERTSALLVVSVAMAAAAYGVSLYYTPLFFAFTHGATPLQAGLDLLPFIGTFVGTTILANVLLPRLRMYAPLYVLGGGIIVIGSALQSLVTVDDAKSLVLGKLAMVGAGLGLVFQTGGSVFKALAAGDPVREGEYITAFVTLQMSGVALFTSIGGCIFQNLGLRYVREAINEYTGGRVVVDDENVRRALAGLGSELLGGRQPTAELRRKVIEAVTEVISKLYFIVVAGGAVILICGCLMRWERLEFMPAEEVKEGEA
ncbi:hypothetical protein PspLS_11301 [Pyricularia sp. CBS 133598]|nr:hypothetical protein PspLS_11301 [Pyricularia sp. CBS 133598]